MSFSKFFNEISKFFNEISNFFNKISKFFNETLLQSDLRPKGKSLSDNKPLYSSNSIWILGNVMDYQMFQWTFPKFMMITSKFVHLFSKFFNVISKFFNEIYKFFNRISKNFNETLLQSYLRPLEGKIIIWQ